MPAVSLQFIMEEARYDPKPGRDHLRADYLKLLKRARACIDKDDLDGCKALVRVALAFGRALKQKPQQRPGPL